MLQKFLAIVTALGLSCLPVSLADRANAATFTTFSYNQTIPDGLSNPVTIVFTLTDTLPGITAPGGGDNLYQIKIFNTEGTYMSGSLGAGYSAIFNGQTLQGSLDAPPLQTVSILSFDLASILITVTSTTGGPGAAPADTSFTVDFINETPLPAALPLFATGLGALGLLGWRRKRKAQPLAV